ncbi:MAG: alpha/beta fold hydrolase [Actinomycetota bacterium]
MTTGLEHDFELLRSFDGTPIATRLLGGGAGLPVLVVNAIGANLAAWRRALVDLVEERPVLTWDHRGLHASGPPATDRLDAGAHAEDAVAALDRHGFERCAVVAWSSGTRIGLELVSRYPERVAGMVLVCGSYGHSLGRLLRLELGSFLPLVASVAKYFSWFVEGPLAAVASRPELAGLIRQSGFVGATADGAALADIFRGMAACDMRMLLESYEKVAGDPAPHLLDSISCAVLAVAGNKDIVTPPALMEATVERIPGARLTVYEGATHYLPIEFPARLSEDIRKFLSDLPAG